MPQDDVRAPCFVQLLPATESASPPYSRIRRRPRARRRGCRTSPTTRTRTSTPTTCRPPPRSTRPPAPARTGRGRRCPGAAWTGSPTRSRFSSWTSTTWWGSRTTKSRRTSKCAKRCLCCASSASPRPATQSAARRAPAPPPSSSCFSSSFPLLLRGGRQEGEGLLPGARRSCTLLLIARTVAASVSSSFPPHSNDPGPAFSLENDPGPASLPSGARLRAVLLHAHVAELLPGRHSALPLGATSALEGGPTLAVHARALKNRAGAAAAAPARPDFAPAPPKFAPSLHPMTRPQQELDKRVASQARGRPASVYVVSVEEVQKQSVLYFQVCSCSRNIVLIILSSCSLVCRRLSCSCI